jgi:hypothetical protein
LPGKVFLVNQVVCQGLNGVPNSGLGNQRFDFGELPIDNKSDGGMSCFVVSASLNQVGASLTSLTRYRPAPDGYGSFGVRNNWPPAGYFHMATRTRAIST